MPVQILTITIGIVLLGIFFFTIRFIFGREAKLRRIAQREQTVDWQNATKVQDLISLYLDVLLTHGPDSTEAKSFRFGVGNSELWQGNESMDVFSMMIDICDGAVRRHKSWKLK